MSERTLLKPVDANLAATLLRAAMKSDAAVEWVAGNGSNNGGRPNALTRSVGAIDDFCRQTWERRWRHYPKMGNFDDLLSEADVDRLLGGQLLRSAHLRLVKNGGQMPPSSYIRAISQSSKRPDREVVELLAMVADGAPDPRLVAAAIDDGASVVLQGIQRYHPPVALFCREISSILGQRCQANAYLTPPTAQALNNHTDPHGVLVLQIYGTKQWNVGPAPWQADDGSPTEVKLAMQPGDVLYLPKGTPHCAHTTDGVSLHLTIGIEVYKWQHVLSNAVQKLLNSGDYNDPLPAGWFTDEQRFLDTLSSEIQRLSGDLSPVLEEGYVDMLVEHGVNQRTLPKGRLFSRFSGLDVSGSSTLRRRWSGPVRIAKTGEGTLLVMLGDRAFCAPPDLRSALRVIANGSTFTPVELPIADLDTKLQLCRELYACDFLEVVDDSPRGEDLGC